MRFKRFYLENRYDKLLVGEWAQLAFDADALFRAWEKAGNEAQAAVDAAIAEAVTAGKKYRGQRSVKAKFGASLLSKELQKTATSPLTRLLEARWDAFWEQNPCVLSCFVVVLIYLYNCILCEWFVCARGRAGGRGC